MEKLTPQEESAMLQIWKLGECVIKDILNEMPEPKPPYTTLASVVKNLEQKGYLDSKKYGNVYVYSPRIGEEEYKKEFLSGVVENYFENSYKNLVSFFAREEKISPDELAEIISIIEKGKQK